MACIKLQSQWGIRVIAEHTPYTLLRGERIIGVVWNCATTLQVDNVELELEKEGLQLGDAVAWATKRLGIKQCAPCKARQEILNHVKQNGWLETIKQIKDTF